MSFVEKVHLLEEHILRLCNLIVPNAAENQCPNIRIDFNSLNQISLPTIGFYGDKRTMGRILKEMGVLDHSIHKQMEEDKLEPEHACQNPSAGYLCLKTGYYYGTERFYFLEVFQ